MVASAGLVGDLDQLQGVGERKDLSRRRHCGHGLGGRGNGERREG
ncbi:hypothetical protein [Streptomyces sp. NPDC047981]